MRSGGSVLEAPPGAEEGALPRERECKAAQCIPFPGVGTSQRRKCSCGAGAPSSRRQDYLIRGAAEGALPREPEHEDFTFQVAEDTGGTPPRA